MMTEKEFDDALADSVEEGFVEPLPGGKFRLTDKGKARVRELEAAHGVAPGEVRRISLHEYMRRMGVA